jgi:hypothetical protein
VHHCMCCRAQVEGLRSCVAERKKAGMSNGTINRDLDVLRGVLKRAKLWYVMAEEDAHSPCVTTSDAHYRMMKSSGC